MPIYVKKKKLTEKNNEIETLKKGPLPHNNQNLGLEKWPSH